VRGRKAWESCASRKVAAVATLVAASAASTVMLPALFALMTQIAGML
jgi:hypothetical protein